MNEAMLAFHRHQDECRLCEPVVTLGYIYNVNCAVANGLWRGACVEQFGPQCEQPFRGYW